MPTYFCQIIQNIHFKVVSCFNGNFHSDEEEAQCEKDISAGHPESLSSIKYRTYGRTNKKEKNTWSFRSFGLGF